MAPKKWHPRGGCKHGSLWLRLQTETTGHRLTLLFARATRVRATICRVKYICYFCDVNSFTQQYIMAVFAVKYRLGLIDHRWANSLYAIMGKILLDIDGVKPIKINGFKDHVHVLYSTRGNVADSEIVRRLKTESSRWLNDQRLTVGNFGWQRGGARISVSPTRLHNLLKYIDSQWEYHRTRTFREEYESWLSSMGVSISSYDLPDELE